MGLPRSGTTWAANWLTYGGEVCVHDPLYYTHYNDWDASYDSVSCTGIYDWPEFIAVQECPVLVLHRPVGEVRASLMDFDTHRQGAWLDWDADRRLADITAPNVLHVNWSAMFTPSKAALIWRFLHMPSQFDAVRHAQLVRMRIQPAFTHPEDADMQLHSRLMAELRARKARDKAEAGG